MESPQITEQISIEELATLIRLEWEKANKKRQIMRESQKTFGTKISEAEIERAGHEHDKKAEAYQMVMDSIVARKISNSVGSDMAERLELVKGEYKDGGIEVKEEIKKPSKETPVKPKIEDKEIQKEAESIIEDAEVEESIYEAAKLAKNKTSSNHWDIARSKVTHFYAGSDVLPQNPSEHEIDNFIHKIINKVQERKQNEMADNIGFNRETTNPLTDPESINKVSYVRKGNFNYAIFLGGKEPKNEKENEDRVKLIIINEFTKGNRRKAVQIAKNFYSSKNWTDFEAEEFVHLLMKKEPHKELNMVIRGILEDKKKKKGDPKQGIKICRNIVGAYLGTKYTVQVGKTPLSEKNRRANELIDRFINRQLKEIK